MRETFTDVVQAAKRCGTVSKTRLLLCSEKRDFVGVQNNRFVVKEKNRLYINSFS